MSFVRAAIWRLSIKRFDTGLQRIRVSMSHFNLIVEKHKSTYRGNDKQDAKVI